MFWSLADLIRKTSSATSRRKLSDSNLIEQSSLSESRCMPSKKAYLSLNIYINESRRTYGGTSVASAINFVSCMGDMNVAWSEQFKNGFDTINFYLMDNHLLYFQ